MRLGMRQEEFGNKKKLISSDIHKCELIYSFQ